VAIPVPDEKQSKCGRPTDHRPLWQKAHEAATLNGTGRDLAGEVLAAPQPDDGPAARCRSVARHDPAPDGTRSLSGFDTLRPLYGPLARRHMRDHARADSPC